MRNIYIKLINILGTLMCVGLLTRTAINSWGRKQFSVALLLRRNSGWRASGGEGRGATIGDMAKAIFSDNFRHPYPSIRRQRVVYLLSPKVVGYTFRSCVIVIGIEWCD